MKDGLLGVLQRALTSWGGKLADVWQLLTSSPQNFKGGGIWSVIVNINTAMQGIAYGLLVLFFAAGVLNQTINFSELRRPETALKVFLRFAVAKGIVTYSLELLTGIITVAQGILATVMGAGGGDLGLDYLTVSGEIAEAIEDVNFFQSVGMSAIIHVGSLIATVMAFVLIMTVYGRFVKLYMLTAFAPIPLSTFAGDHISQTGRNFFKNYAAACLEFAVVGLALVISSRLIGSPSVVNADAAPNVQVWGYLEEVLFNMFLVVGMIKGCDRVAQAVFGL